MFSVSVWGSNGCIFFGTIKTSDLKYFKATWSKSTCLVSTCGRGGGTSTRARVLLINLEIVEALLTVCAVCIYQWLLLNQLITNRPSTLGIIFKYLLNSNNLLFASYNILCSNNSLADLAMTTWQLINQCHFIFWMGRQFNAKILSFQLLYVLREVKLPLMTETIDFCYSPWTISFLWLP